MRSAGLRLSSSIIPRNRGSSSAFRRQAQSVRVSRGRPLRTAKYAPMPISNVLERKPYSRLGRFVYGASFGFAFVCGFFIGEVLNLKCHFGESLWHNLMYLPYGLLTIVPLWIWLPILTGIILTVFSGRVLRSRSKSLMAWSALAAFSGAIVLYFATLPCGWFTFAP